MLICKIIGFGVGAVGGYNKWNDVGFGGLCALLGFGWGAGVCVLSGFGGRN